MTEQENLRNPEQKKRTFDSRDLTPLEHVIIGSSMGVEFQGTELEINKGMVRSLFKDEQTRAVVLSPMNLTEGKKSLAEILKARRQIKPQRGYLSLFEANDTLLFYLKKGIYPAFVLGDLNEKGEMVSFGVHFSYGSEKIHLPENAYEKFVLVEDLTGVIIYERQKEGVMKFKIK